MGVIGVIGFIGFVGLLGTNPKPENTEAPQPWALFGAPALLRARASARRGCRDLLGLWGFRV